MLPLVIVEYHKYTYKQKHLLLWIFSVVIAKVAKLDFKMTSSFFKNESCHQTKFFLNKFISVRYSYTFLIDCEHFELWSKYIKQRHIVRSNKPLKWNHYITLLQRNYFERNTWYCTKKFTFCIFELPTVISDIRQT